MSRPLFRAALLVGCLTFLGRPSHAQFEGLIGGITDVSLNASCSRANARFADDDCLGKSTIGIEMIWRAREVARNGRTRVPAVSRADSATKWWILELALGYSQFSTLRSEDASFELRGTARELPALTVYLSFDGYLGAATPYVGLRSGIIDIQNLQAVDGVLGDEATVYTASPRAFQFGGIVGVAFGNWMLQPRIEYAYFLREFPSLQWSPGKVSSRIPRELSFSGSSLSVGMQVSLRDLKP